MCLVLDIVKEARKQHGDQSYQLVSKRNLVEFHLVDASLGRAQKRGSGKKSALHDGQSD